MSNISDLVKIKAAIWENCAQEVQQRIQTIESVLASITESRNNETKSSVGDKYETGRAMMQQKEDQNSRQLLQAKQDLMVLNLIKNKAAVKKVALGSLVVMDNGNTYYLSIGIGKLIVEEQKIFVISPDAPIGKCLMYREKESIIQFNSVNMTIQLIA